MRAFLQRPLLQLRISQRVFAPSVWSAALMLAVVSVFLHLGHWQQQRAHEKEIMQTRYEARAHLPALPLQRVLQRGDDIADFPLELHGEFDNAHTFFLDNQPQDGRAGFHVYTPFLPQGERVFILVNRGWLPRAQNAALLPPVSAATINNISGSVTKPSAFFVVGEINYQLRPLRVPRLEMAQLSKTLGVELRPFVLRLNANSADGFVRKWAPSGTASMSPDRHRAYAFQWFALAFAVFCVFVAVNVQKVGADCCE